jgi:hypothetical protein
MSDMTLLALNREEEEALRDALHDWSHMAAAWMSAGDAHVQVAYRNLDRIMRELRVNPRLPHA